jgi:hypothetical protein
VVEFYTERLDTPRVNYWLLCIWDENTWQATLSQTDVYKIGAFIRHLPIVLSMEGGEGVTEFRITCIVNTSFYTATCIINNDINYYLTLDSKAFLVKLMGHHRYKYPNNIYTNFSSKLSKYPKEIERHKIYVYNKSNVYIHVKIIKLLHIVHGDC